MNVEKLEESKDTLNIPNGISTPVPLNLINNLQNATELDFSKRDIEEIDENITLPSCLRNLNLSHNKLREVPKIVLDHKDLKVLDISHNKIEYFNDAPSFCHAIEFLNLANNALKCPPLWVWLESPRNLSKIDISCNMNLTYLLQEHIDELLEYKTLLQHIILYNCKLGRHLKFIASFQKAKDLQLGTPDWSCYASNHLQELPCQGLDKCCDIERLILPNTHIYTITPKIKVFKNLREIDLSQNNLNGIPTEFCELENLEICILSFNNILYIPDDIVKLKKLTTLCLAVNELCMIPSNITELANLRILDLYDNNISAFPEEIKSVPELDLAQNYFVEPEDSDYLERRNKLRQNNPDRQNGRKFEIEKPDSDHSPDTTDDEEFIEDMGDRGDNQNREPSNEPPSSPEDWDSDSYWEPHVMEHTQRRPNRYWMCFIKRAMENGNLCPIDKHTVPVMDMVKYEKMCNPQEEYESEGQFDDYSEDDS